MILKEISDFNDKFIKGEDIELSYAKEIIKKTLDSEDIIKAELKKLTVAELRKMTSTHYTKKSEIIDKIYDSQINKMYFFISGENTISYIFDGGKSGSWKEQQKKKIDNAFSELTEERLIELLKDRKKDHETMKERKKEFYESIKNPKTLSDFQRAKSVRDLTTEEQRLFEEMKAAKEKEELKEKQSKMAEKLSLNGTYSVEKTQDTRDARDLWVVKFEQKSDDFKSLNRQMKGLGGTGYSRFTRGFNFYSDPTEKLNNLFKSNSEETEKTATEIEENTIQVSNKAVEKLRSVADNMQKTIDGKLSSDRLVNTARRARMAANAEKEGEYLKKIQTIIYNIAALIEKGEAKYLDKISAKTHIETLENILRDCKNKYIKMKSKEKYPNEESYSSSVIEYEKELRESTDTLFNSIDVAEYPLTNCYKNFLKRLVDETTDVRNTTRIRRNLEHYIYEVQENTSEVYTKNFAEDIVELYEKGNGSGKFQYFNSSDIDNYKRLKALDIKNTIMLRAALREYCKARGNFQETEEEKKKREIKEIERSLIGTKIQGYFPTPKNIVEQMLEYADIQDGDTILEPSAGSGHIADIIKENYPNNKLNVIEINSSLYSILEKKGHNVIANDFLSFNGEYDKIIMNPPFENNQDIEHVLHAFSLLKPGGKVVAIMSEHPFFAKDKKSEEFMEWLADQKQSFDKKLPEGSFLESDRSTGVNTRIVTVRKPKIKLSLYDQLLENKIDVLDILKEGVSLNKYAVEFNTLYHKKILKLLENKDEKLKEIIIDYLMKSKISSKELIGAFEISKIINSKDFNRESNKIKSEIVLGFQKILTDGDIKYLKEYVVNYRKLTSGTAFGFIRNSMLQSIITNFKNFNIEDTRNNCWDLLKGNTDEVKAINEAITIWNDLEKDVVSVGEIAKIKDVIDKYINICSGKAELSTIKDLTVWNDFVTHLKKYKATTTTENRLFRYYLTSRPTSIGTQPTGAVNTKTFDTKQFVKEINREAWGYVDYNKKLTPVQIHDYELIELKTFENRKKKAKEDILLSGVAYNGIRTVKIVADFYKENVFNVEVIENGSKYIPNQTSLSYNESIEYAIKELFYEVHNKKEEKEYTTEDNVSNNEIRKNKFDKKYDQLNLFSLV